MNRKIAILLGLILSALMIAQNNTNSPCNVDIYVVRPIIHNIGTPNAELYYLIMNDHPWTTNLN